MDKIIDRNYGSIPHLSTSKLSQQADKKISEGQEKILTKKSRDWKDLVVVTEKVDGSNAGIIKKNGKLYAITRAGYEACTSRFEQHHYFQNFVINNADRFSWLPENYRVCGEWCLQAHGTKMDISNESPFVLFDIFNGENTRVPFLYFTQICARYKLQHVKLLHIGQPISIKNCIKLLGDGFYGAPEKPEGFVMRCERGGCVDFLAKWVRSDKEDGKYMKDVLWNEGSEQYKTKEK